MSFRGRLSKGLFCLILCAASIGGAPMCPEEIEELMSSMNLPKIEYQIPNGQENGEELLRKLLSRE
jgi:hypothetical protein